MEENHYLLRPLLRLSTTTVVPRIGGQSNPGIIFRLFLVALIGIVSIWANHEASKGYAITILNESGCDTYPGKRFQLFYVSNDEATRIVVKASKVVESFLYPDNSNCNTKKPVRHIILKLAGQNLTDNVIVDSGFDHVEFVLNLSPSIMGNTNFGQAMILALRQGVARVWLWDGQGNTPKSLVNGIVEYMMTDKLVGWRAMPSQDRAALPRSASACWKHEDPRVVAGFLSYCERRRPGFIRRLNGAMKDGWDDGVWDGIWACLLIIYVQPICYKSLRYTIFQALVQHYCRQIET